jgi:hypothetical protein
VPADEVDRVVGEVSGTLVKGFELRLEPARNG